MAKIGNDLVRFERGGVVAEVRVGKKEEQLSRGCQDSLGLFICTWLCFDAIFQEKSEIIGDWGFSCSEILTELLTST